ncbi:unnamed protein product, partial [Rotaria sordida]
TSTTSTATTTTSTATTSTSATSTTSTATTTTSTATTSTSATSTTSTATSTTSTATTSTSATSTTSTATTTTSTATTSTSATSTATTTTSTATTSTTSTSTSTTSPSTSTTSTSTTSTSSTSTLTTTSESTTTLTSTSSTSSTFSSTSTTTTTTTTGYTPDACRNSSQVALPNGTCISSSTGQEFSAGILNSGNASSFDLANALSLYISSNVNSNTSSSPNNTVTVNTIDEVLDKLNNITITVNSTNSFLIAQELSQTANDIVLGASFLRNSGGEIVRNSTEQSALISQFSIAAIVAKESLVNVTSLKMFIIDKPTMYENIDNTTNRSLASSLIVASVTRAGSSSNLINVSLYFKVLPEYQPNVNATYLCSFYDTNNSRWDERGCTDPRFNEVFNRYECSCNHLTSFALIWLPQSLLGSYGRDLRTADIASLVFQSVSVVCFLAIMIHAIGIRIFNPLMHFQANNLLPLISCASTAILFIFYIALGMTVYTQTTSEKETKCFLSSSILMFFVYFFLIFMFCTKTSIGYFNYLRFVHLFPQPSLRRLFILLTISFFFSISWVSFAAGFNSNSSFNITQLYPYRLCWFTRGVVYYFMTIPICMFLLMNFFTIICVAKHIIDHVRNATSPHQTYERMKRCVLVLLSSSVTQGIGWLFGPFISFVSPTAGEVLEWFFIVFNGLEGVWSILLYIIILSQRIDEQKRVTAAIEVTRSSSIKASRYEKRSGRDDRRRSSDRIGEAEVVQRDTRRESIHASDDLSDDISIDWRVNENDTSSF